MRISTSSSGSTARAPLLPLGSGQSKTTGAAGEEAAEVPEAAGDEGGGGGGGGAGASAGSAMAQGRDGRAQPVRPNRRQPLFNRSRPKPEGSSRPESSPPAPWVPAPDRTDFHPHAPNQKSVDSSGSYSPPLTSNQTWRRRERKTTTPRMLGAWPRLPVGACCCGTVRDPPTRPGESSPRP